MACTLQMFYKRALFLPKGGAYSAASAVVKSKHSKAASRRGSRRLLCMVLSLETTYHSQEATETG